MENNKKIDILSLVIWFKNLFDFLLGVNPISSLSAPVYFLLTIFESIRKIPVAIFVFFFTPVVLFWSDSLRSFLSILLIWGFYYKIIENKKIIHSALIAFCLVISFFIFIGTFYGGFYTNFDYLLIQINKYRFIYNDPNNFGPYACAYQAVLIYAFFKQKKNLSRIIIFFIILGVNYGLFKSLGRMYNAIGLFQLFAFLSFKYGRKFVFKLSMIPLITLVIALIYFTSSTDNSAIAQRLLNLSLSGRDRLSEVFFYHAKSEGWGILFGSTLEHYERIKFNTFGLPRVGMSLCENSYMATVINMGISGLVFVLMVLFLILKYLFKGRLYVSLMFAILYFSVWYFDDSLIYPISILHQMVSISAIIYTEKYYLNSLIGNDKEKSSNISPGISSL